MRINGSALNRAALNQGAARLAVRFDSTAVLAGDSLLEGRRTRCATVQAAAVCSAGWQAAALRFLNTPPARVDSFPACVLSAARAGKGSGTIGSEASLYYTRAVPFAGGAALVLSAYGDVGVVFGESTAVLGLDTTATGARKRAGGGAALVRRAGSLAARAIRRSTSADTSVSGVPCIAELDSAHIHAGVRTLDGSGTARLPFTLVDDGLRRQTLLGAAYLTIGSAGQGRVIRQVRPTEGITRLAATGDFYLWRRGRAVADIAPLSELDGAIFVRGTASAVTALVAAGTAYSWRQTLAGTALFENAVSLTGTRRREAEGLALLACALDGMGVRGRQLTGEAVLESIGEQEATLNPFSLDEGDQRFRRAQRPVAFMRPVHLSVWRRP